MTQQERQTELKQALHESIFIVQKLQKKLASYHEPIAVIGMACRFPSADTPEAFWDLLHQGVDMMQEIPDDRWEVNAHYDPTPGTPGKSYVREAALLAGIEQFDPHFFGISPREALLIDPQQRLLLEVTWEALERAGLAPDSLIDSQTGVFIGVSSSDYHTLMDEATRYDVYASTGNRPIFASGRLAYLLGLQGPNLVIDTACSASLIGVHLACESLRNGSSDLALAGGSHLILTPHGHISMAQMQALALDGRCKTFDAAANGFGRGEGCGMVVLKRLTDAQRDGDNILAVIRGSATNHDGVSSGLTVPSATAQAALIRRALADAQVAADEVSYLEAHGTGTSLGDPIEVRAIATVFGKRATPLLIGSVKTNLGHLEETAGIASLMKVILAMQHDEIPPHLHFHHPNPHIDWERSAIAVPTTCTPWPAVKKLAGISSFGMGGSNAHVVVEEAPATTRPMNGCERPWHLVTLSAKNEQALHALAQRYWNLLQEQPALALGDLCYTAYTGRNHFVYRLSIAASSATQMATDLAAYAAGKPTPGTQYASLSEHQASPKIAFLFTGQGSQYVGMGCELYQTSPTFRAILDHCDGLFQQKTGTSLLAILFPEASETVDSKQSPISTLQSPILVVEPPNILDDTTYTQPALFVLEYALATLWQSWGIQPDILIGHSIGELAAACVAGVFSLEDGLKLVTARGRLMGALPQDGEMVSLQADEARVRCAIAPYTKEVSIAAVNGPESIVIAGKREAVLTIADQLAREGVKTRKLTVSHAFHSPLMEPMLADFRQVAQTITYHQPKLRLSSNVTGKLTGEEITTPEYWVRHVRETVRFGDGLQTVRDQGTSLFLEIGPKPVLLGMADQSSNSQATPASIYLPSLRPGHSDWQQMLTSLGELYVRGVSIDWQGFEKDYHRRKVVLPTYPFQRQRYWIETNTDIRQMPAVTDGFAQWLGTHNIDQLTDWITSKAAFSTEERATVTRVLSTLEAESQAQQMAAQVTSMLYDVTWERQTKPLSLTSPTTPGRWVLVTDGQAVGESLASQLEELGETVQLVTSQTDLSALLAQITTANRLDVPLRNLVYLPAREQMTPFTGVALMQQQEQTLGNLLHLVQTLAEQPANSTRLWVVTQGAQQIAASQAVTLLQTPLWGLGRVIALEHGELWGGLIDLDPAAEPTAAAQSLLAELLQQQPDNETQIAYRQGVRHVARLVQGKVKQSTQHPTIYADAVYLVTGGLGALGLIVAQWLTAQGAKYLILTGRRGITNQEQQNAVDGLAAQGVNVQVAQLDVADEAAMRKLFASLTTSATPLKGVFHTAGVLDDGILLNQSWERFATVLSAKVIGSWLLHELTRDLELDYFVFFSSVASLLGNLGQGNYAAANAFLDGLARYRRQQGLPALSINWGAWADGGMATRTTQVKVAADHLITAEIGTTALTQLLAQGENGPAQIAVAPIDWSQLAGMDKPSPFLRNFVTTAETSAIKPTLVTELAALPTNRRLEHLRTYLQQSIGRVLGMTDLPDRATGFTDLGMDSLMALELRRHLERELGQPLPTTLAFEYPTVDALAIYLLTEVLTLAEPTRAEQDTALQRRRAGMDEPIAVISIACRFPAADTPEAFWQLLCGGVDTVQEIPSTRWNIDEYYDPQRPVPGKMYMREAAFVDAVEQFDPLFFGIAPREATGMDPMHRLLLEVSWEALERAGLAQSSLVDSQTGVFVGIGEGEYGALHDVQNLAELDTHAATSGGHSIAAGRLAYTLGLQGPTLAVDTACSSSLVSLHLACQSLRAGECDLALAGGVSLMLSPMGHVALSQMQALAPDGRCKTFDASADGYGRGEGGAMVLLKRLSDAQADGDEILAVIQGSAVNHDGPSSGLTVPNKRAQEKLLRQALTNAKVQPDEVAYVEAHGTGTPLGDPIEIRALGAVFGAERKQPLFVGSVKTNVGHLEAAAGIVGFVKTVLALHHGQIPPHLHFTQPNPYIEWDEFAIEVPTQLQSWPSTGSGHARIAGISSFGISGTNAHVIVASAPVQEDKKTGRQEDKEQGRPAQLLTIAAKSESALRAYAQRYRDFLTHSPDVDLADLCYTAAVGRNHFNQRLGLVAQDRADLLAKLTAVAQSQEVAGVAQGGLSQTTPRIAFLFTGQGSQYLHMGATLYQTEPVFRDIIDRCDAVAQTVLGRSLIELLYPETTPEHNDLIDSHPCGQAVNFAVECALVALWKAWGIEPDYVLGHSLGDFAAAYAAGVLSLEDGLRLVSERGRLMEHAVGSMVSVMAAEAEVVPFVEGYADVVIGVINGPYSVVISGGHANVTAAEVALQAAGIKTRRVAVPMAAHSPLLNPVLDAFEALVRDTVPLHPPQLSVVSSMTGKLVNTELTDPLYWRQHLRNPVRFADGVATLAAAGCTFFVEIGPKPTLLGMVGQIVEDTPQLALLPALHHERDARQQMLTALAEMYVRGVAVDWTTLYDATIRRKVTLPTYPFQRQRYWRDVPPKVRRQVGLLPLIDRKLELPTQHQTILEKLVSTETLPFLADHLLYDKVAMPGACHLSFVLSSFALTTETGQCEIEDVIFQKVLVLAANEERIVQILLDKDAQARTFQTISFPASAPEQLVTHATGRLKPLNRTTPVVDFAAIQARCSEAVEPTRVYELIQDTHIELGPTFRWFNQIWRGQGEALAQLTIPEAIATVAGYQLFPSLIDACFQLAAALQVRVNGDEATVRELTTAIPFAVESLRLYQTTNHQNLWCHIQQVEEQKWNIQLLTHQGEIVATIDGFRVREAPVEAIYTRDTWKEWLYTVAWQESARSATTQGLTQATAVDATRSQTWLIFADTKGIGEALSTLLRKDGASTVLVVQAEAYHQIDAQTFAVNPDSAADYQQLLATIATRHEGIHGIVHLWSLDDVMPESAEELMQTTQQGCGSILHLVQALLHGQIQPAGLWLVTENAQMVHDDEPVEGFAQSALWGMGRVLELEHPEFNTVRIDLDRSLNRQTQATLLQAELTTSPVDEPRETQVALRQTAEQTSRYVARLTTYEEQPPCAITLDGEATYLITGGLGGIGLEVAEWLVAEGARHLLLTGRSQPNNEAQTRLAALTALGAQVTYAQVDVTDQSAMAHLLAQMDATHPLRGVIHSVGVLADGALLQQTWANFEKVLRPKLIGAWHLHTLTRSMALDFFVLFSSAAGLLGNRGQANHAAANAFLDAFACYRHAQGLPALSINWGAWAEVGIAAELVRQHQPAMTATGMEAISPEQGIAAFAGLLQQAVPQVGVIPINWSRFGTSDRAPSPFFALMAAQFRRRLPQQTPQATVNMLEKLAALPSHERSKQLTNYLRTEIAHLLGIADTEQIAAQQPLFELGIDSLTALELKNKLQAGLGTTLHSTLVFDYPTLHGLTTYLLDYLFEKPEQANSVRRQQSARSETLVERTATITALSEEEAEAYLLEKLSNL